MSETNLDLESRLDDGVLFLTKQNEATSYGISLGIARALTEAMERAKADDAIRAVVIDAGGPGFHRGAVMVTELKPSLDELDDADFRDIVHRGQDLGRRISALPKPVIGIARAGALGGGLEQLLRCDFVYTLDDAQFSFPEVTLGFVAAWGGTQWGGRMMAMRRAQEFLLLGEAISGAAAAREGLVTRSFANAEALDAHLSSVLERLRYCSSASFAQTKRCLSAIWEGPLAQGEATEVDAEAIAMGTGDFRKAYAAWREGQVFNYASGKAEPRT
ncbi:enoyl-CoA hydratase [Novosphingobium marinum]|uniref:Enoyl-CoA hydratase/carnithine racemase n=1 Tax=Novosphingobium marinum TaxID=1514948 RepID=A0A7Y9XUG0_9SPHN|nr:enoyl-CoA hydratase/isomerase family protein [Novosphingobium marinum]NYH94814.1 enoyl-CoA hydratase/carnithine racemase [Novosphingobium marinum]GGC37134.1 enoyl-CoA hydratase [Novosphingobium marinum]